MCPVLGSSGRPRAQNGRGPQAMRPVARRSHWRAGPTSWDPTGQVPEMPSSPCFQHLWGIATKRRHKDRVLQTDTSRILSQKPSDQFHLYQFSFFFFLMFYFIFQRERERKRGSGEGQRDWGTEDLNPALRGEQ